MYIHSVLLNVTLISKQCLHSHVKLMPLSKSLMTRELRQYAPFLWRYEMALANLDMMILHSSSDILSLVFRASASSPPSHISITKYIFCGEATLKLHLCGFCGCPLIHKELYVYIYGVINMNFPSSIWGVKYNVKTDFRRLERIGFQRICCIPSSSKFIISESHEFNSMMWIDFVILLPSLIWLCN